MQTKSENHETRRGIVLSHVEAVVKNCEGFEQVMTSDAKNPDISTCDPAYQQTLNKLEQRLQK